MNKLKRMFMFSILSLTLPLTIGVVAFATIAHVGGGTWTYGYTDPGNGYYMGYSYYYHPSNTHTSSVSVNGTVYRSALTAPGYTSMINSPSTTSTDIQCYYNSKA